MKRILTAVIFLLLLCGGAVTAAVVAEGPARALGLATSTQEGASGEHVTLCHRTFSATNPYVVINVDFDSIEDARNLRGHADHVDDIIPPYTFSDNSGTFSFPGQGDQTILANGCNVPGTTSTSTSTTTTGTTVTINPETTFTAGAICVISEQRYRVVGTVNGNIASVTPQFIAGNTVGPTVVIVTLGPDTAPKVVITDGTCVMAATGPGTTTGTTGTTGTGTTPAGQWSTIQLLSTGRNDYDYRARTTTTTPGDTPSNPGH
jgi:hypothetical protein